MCARLRMRLKKVLTEKRAKFHTEIKGHAFEVFI